MEKELRCPDCRRLCQFVLLSASLVKFVVYHVFVYGQTKGEGLYSISTCRDFRSMNVHNNHFLLSLSLHLKPDLPSALLPEDLSAEVRVQSSLFTGEVN